MSTAESTEIATRPTTHVNYKPEFENIYPLQFCPRISGNVLIDKEFEGQTQVPSNFGAARNVGQEWQELSMLDAPWGALRGTSNAVFRGVVHTVIYIGHAFDNISRSSSIWRNANLSRAEERAASVNIADASENLFEIRRLTGFSWDQLANLLNVSRDTINKWVKGAKIKGKSREHVAETLSVLRYADQGSAEINAQKFYKRGELERCPDELIKSKNYEAAKQLLSYGPSRPLIRRAASDSASWIGEFQQILMHPEADGTEKIEPIPEEPEAVSRKRPIKHG